MDKKGNRLVQSSAKGIVTDSKKNQDGTGAKLWPRGGRRREPAGNSFPAKNETSRKPIPQRNKTIDKRPKPRGNYNSGAMGGNEITGLVDKDIELGSVFMQGSKKQSLNHLLNFHYEPRENRSHSDKMNTSKLGHRWLTTFKHRYNKEQFLQANCQFVVKSSGNYKQYMNNPDTLVDWSLIEQVNVQVSEFPSCPICLYPPVAAKMTRCGHIYCWSCMLHYLSLSDKAWHKCPICFEAVHKQDLKSVVSIPHSPFNVNETIKFKLMKRQRGSLIAYPADETIREGDDIMFNMSENSATNIHCKLLLADNTEVLSIIERERKELETSLKQDVNIPEKCFIDEALSLLMLRENNIFLQLDNVKEPLERKDQHDKHIDTESKLVENECTRGENIDEIGAELNVDVKNQNLNCEAIKDFNDSDRLSTRILQQPVKYFYFYQACDGQHIYLHAINARMLEHTYGSLEMSPKTIEGRIIEKEGGSMTEELRNRLRYLQHLPVTCQFEVAEIQLREPIISKETLQTFYDQLETRRKRRQRRAKDEKRREKRILEEENRKMGKYPVANIHLDSPQQFPDFTGEHFISKKTESDFPERSLSPISKSSTTTASSSLAGSLNAEHEYAGPSFAKMVSSVKKPTVLWPELKNQQPSSSSPHLVNVTGSKPKTLVHKQSDSELGCEDYVPAPEFNRSFGDAIALALEKASFANNIGDGDIKKLGKKKNKKNKQKVLFATSMTYNNN